MTLSHSPEEKTKENYSGFEKRQRAQLFVK